MKFWFALIALTFCLAGAAAAVTPPAVNILGPDLHHLLILTDKSGDGGDVDPWVDGDPPRKGQASVVDKESPWCDDPPRKGQCAADKENPWGDEVHPWTEKPGNSKLN